MTGSEEKFHSGIVCQALFLKEMAHAEAAKKYVKGGLPGILLSDDSKGDYVELSATYFVRWPVGFFPAAGKVTIRAKCRKWTGFCVAEDVGEEDGPYVYITETGTVYHKSETCSHLLLSVRSVDITLLDTLRNENGRKYSACELCAARKKRKDTVYITNLGGSYHFDPGCSGLKRTIYKVRLSEVNGRAACSRCGK